MEITTHRTPSTPDAATPHGDGVPPLLTMPIELILRITRHLSTTDLCSFRLTCRGLEQAVLDSFASEFFTRKQFMMSKFSLDALIDIAKSRFGPRLTQLHLGLDRLQVSSLELTSLSQEHAERLKDLTVDQGNLWAFGQAIDLLTEALRHLKGLEVVVIRDFDSETRYRDGPAAPWRSYGSTTMLRQCGIRPGVKWLPHRGGLYGSTEQSINTDYATQVFAAVLKSLAQANARPTSLKIYARKAHQVADHVFRVPESMDENLMPILNGLTGLHLCVQPSQSSETGIDHTSLAAFLADTPNLDELRINCANEHADMRLTVRFRPFLQWLAKPPAPPDLPWLSAGGRPQIDLSERPRTHWASAPIALRKLRTFSLGSLTACPGDILAIIRKFSSHLRRLELWRLTLIQPDANSAGYAPRTKGCLWVSFFRGLLEIPDLKLKSLHIGRVRIATRLRNDGWIRFFKRERKWDQEPPVEIRYHGRDWRAFVRELSMAYHSGWEAQSSARRAVESYVNRGGDGDHEYSDEEFARRTAALDRLVARTTYHVDPVGGWDEDEYFEDVQSEWIHDIIELSDSDSDSDFVPSGDEQ